SDLREVASGDGGRGRRGGSTEDDLAEAVAFVAALEEAPAQFERRLPLVAAMGGDGGSQRNFDTGARRKAEDGPRNAGDDGVAGGRAADVGGDRTIVIPLVGLAGGAEDVVKIGGAAPDEAVVFRIDEQLDELATLGRPLGAGRRVDGFGVEVERFVVPREREAKFEERVVGADVGGRFLEFETGDRGPPPLFAGRGCSDGDGGAFRRFDGGAGELVAHE